MQLHDNGLGAASVAAFIRQGQQQQQSFRRLEAMTNQQFKECHPEYAPPDEEGEEMGDVVIISGNSFSGEDQFSEILRRTTPEQPRPCPPPRPQPNERRDWRRYWLLWLALILSLIILGISAYYAFDLIQRLVEKPVPVPEPNRISLEFLQAPP